MTKHKSRKLCFVHIPKTAGSTFLQLIYNNYAHEKILYPTSWEEMLKVVRMPREQLLMYDALIGHIPFEALLQTPFMDEASFVIVLRDPVDRVISFYYYVTSHPDHYLFPIVNEKKMSLSEFIDKRLTPELHDGQTRQICSRPLMSAMMTGNYDYIHSFENVTAEDLDKAKSYLERFFSVVGITDHFDEVVKMTSNLLSWNSLIYRNVNVSSNRKKKKDVPFHIRKRIEKNNLHDMELYEFAVYLFKKQREIFEGNGLVKV